MNCAELSQVAEIQAPASEEAIAQVQEDVGSVLPTSYIDLLRCSNGFSVPSVESLIIYAVDEINEMNETNEVRSYLPGWVLIGDDGGGRGIFLDCTDEGGTIYLVGLGSMLRSDARLLASNVIEWIKKGFTLEPSS